MPPVEQTHGNPHQRSIKDIQEHLMLQQIARKALQVFNNPEYTPHQNQQAPSVQRKHVLLPADARVGEKLSGFGSRIAGHPDVKEGRGQDEAAEEDDLDPETAHYDVGARVDGISGFARHEAAACFSVSVYCGD
jgi:hypothetical protein